MNKEDFSNWVDSMGHITEKDVILEQIRKNNTLYEKIQDILESEYPLFKKEGEEFRKKVEKRRKELKEERAMKKNALYIHGFMGNPKGGTFETLKKTLKKWNILSIPFSDLHTDIAKTQELIKSFCKENNIELLIGASLGAFYVLQYGEIIDKLVINPCMYPSVEIPKLKDRSSGEPFILSEEVLSGFREMEKYENIPEEQRLRTFGIFAKDDELFHFKDSFDELFSSQKNKMPNSILINGHHSIEEEYLTEGLLQAEKYL